MYKENHSLDEWFNEAYGDEENTIYGQETGWQEVVQLEEGKPPLCKGRCQPGRLTEGLKQLQEIQESVVISESFLQSPSQKSKIFASPL